MAPRADMEDQLLLCLRLHLHDNVRLPLPKHPRHQQRVREQRMLHGAVVRRQAVRNGSLLRHPQHRVWDELRLLAAASCSSAAALSSTAALAQPPIFPA